MDELHRWGHACLAAYFAAFPDDPQVLAFKASVAELREGLNDGGS